jgi:hypothetical protein
VVSSALIVACNRRDDKDEPSLAASDPRPNYAQEPQLRFRQKPPSHGTDPHVSRLEIIDFQETNIVANRHTYFVLNSCEWLSELRLDETYYSFDPAQYNELFDEELEKVIKRVRDPAHRQILERMRRFGWMSYIAASVRHAGYRDYREGQEKIHDLAMLAIKGAYPAM